jgi:hypothetical protein
MLLNSTYEWLAGLAPTHHRIAVLKRLGGVGIIPFDPPDAVERERVADTLDAADQLVVNSCNAMS